MAVSRLTRDYTKSTRELFADAVNGNIQKLIYSEERTIVNDVTLRNEFTEGSPTTLLMMTHDQEGDGFPVGTAEPFDESALVGHPDLLIKRYNMMDFVRDYNAINGQIGDILNIDEAPTEQSIVNALNQLLIGAGMPAAFVVEDITHIVPADGYLVVQYRPYQPFFYGQFRVSATFEEI